VKIEKVMVGFVAPMLSLAVAWLPERPKFDGYRALGLKSKAESNSRAMAKT
jgi:hypothetical protein